MSHPCPACGRMLLPGQVLCMLDVLFAARRAARAYDVIRRQDPSLAGVQLIETVLSWLSSGHARHRAPELGCPFCRLV